MDFCGVQSGGLSSQTFSLSFQLCHSLLTFAAMRSRLVESLMRTLFEHCHTKGIQLNKEKLKLCCTEVKFMGLCEIGLKPDPDKEQGIGEMSIPTNKQDVN